ncbi:MAG: ATP-binding cassette domain-containing protein [Planctomycetes bacterium]|nr:ATP-binding cassette domain-containing protein [Planctomycetota bacterium]
MSGEDEGKVCAGGRGSSVELKSLAVRVGNRTLLRETTARFAAGEVTLIIGRSGVGKSTLLRIIADLLDEQDAAFRVTGRVELTREDGIAVARRGGVGVVFQDFALFDELSPMQNVRLALAHRPRRAHREESLAPAALLRELGVPTNVRTASLSGGERQRLAIARALAYDPDVMLYDEPTSGLDTATAAEVTKVLAATQANHPRTSIIVTHDFEALTPIADAVYLMDSDEHTLRRVERADWPRLGELLGGKVKPAPPGRQLATAGLLPRWTRWAAGRTGEFLAATSRVLEGCLQLPLRLIPLWKSPAWGIRFFWHYLRAVAGPSAWLYVAIAGAIIGFVATYFTFRFLPSANYTKPLLIEDLLLSMGFSLYRILVPILVTILIAARCGAAVASDVGGKRYGRQIDALRTLGAEPKRYLLTGILYAFLLGTPLLVAISYATAAATSLAVFTSTHPDRGPWFWQLHFHRELIMPGRPWYVGTNWLLGKTTLCAAGIAMLAYARGARPKDSSRAVSQGVTSTILWSTLYVLAVHFVFAFFEFQ